MTSKFAKLAVKVGIYTIIFRTIHAGPDAGVETAAHLVGWSVLAFLAVNAIWALARKS